MIENYLKETFEKGVVSLKKNQYAWAAPTAYSAAPSTELQGLVGDNIKWGVKVGLGCTLKNVTLLHCLIMVTLSLLCKHKLGCKR